MQKICLYLHLHQPLRLKTLGLFDIGKNDLDYFDETENRNIFLKITNKSYIPMLQILLQLLQTHKNFSINLSITGTFLEQANKYAPEVTFLLKQIVETKKCEILGETYYHSLPSMYDLAEFVSQVKLHTKILEATFGPNISINTFRNTELIYSDTISKYVANLGFNAIITEGVESILQDRSPGYIYYNKYKTLKVLLKHYKLSDDIAFRFSDKEWKFYPLQVQTYIEWIAGEFESSEIINLFMDFETFGEHQWKESGIFEFFIEFVEKTLSSSKKYSYAKMSDIANKHSSIDVFESKSNISWADHERDTSAWNGNEMQKNALSLVYSLKKLVRKSKSSKMLQIWRNLQTSDHFYYMSTKGLSDGNVHSYFSPYESPYIAYANYMNTLEDFKIYLQKHYANTEDSVIM